MEYVQATERQDSQSARDYLNDNYVCSCYKIDHLSEDKVPDIFDMVGVIVTIVGIVINNIRCSQEGRKVWLRQRL